MTIKLLALDIDGTTIRNDHLTVPPDNLAALLEAHNRGVQIVIATGRLRSRLPAAIEKLPGLSYVVSSNGAAVSEHPSMRTLFCEAMPAALCMRTFNRLRPLGIYIELYANGQAYTGQWESDLLDNYPLTASRRTIIARCRTVLPRIEDILQIPDLHIEKINLPFLTSELRASLRATLETEEPALALTSSVPTNLELNARGVHKALGLSRLCGMLQIDPSEVMAVGDNENDLEMLAYAGVSVCPANGTEQARAIAKYACPSNEDAGVAHAIRRFILARRVP